MALPVLTKEEMIPLEELRRYNIINFYKDRTNYLFNEMARYIKESMVFRLSIMGKTRSGKSEVGSTIAFYYVKLFNYFMKKGVFDKLDLFTTGLFKKQFIDFSIKYVYSNQMVYMDKLRSSKRDNTLRYGQIHQIDEEKESSGGVGSMSEVIEMTNLNNIIAKFCQSEIWIQPLKLETRNTVFGIKLIKKDIPNKVNWGLLYQTQNDPMGFAQNVFCGWVHIPLHKNEIFRSQYNKMKDNWIDDEISGVGDPRMKKRSETAEMIFKEYPELFETHEKSGRFKTSKNQIKVLINKLILDGKVHPFNELEKEYIVEEAFFIAKNGK